MHPLLASLQGKLIVSCQAQEGWPLRSSIIMAAMARAAELGGAAAIRANTPEDIAAIRAAASLPIIGLWKQDLPGYDVYITPTLAAARAVREAGADIIALDATLRPHPEGRSAAELIAAVKAELGVPVMADVSTLEEGFAAAQAGADLVSTTLSGYTTYSPHREGPDLTLVRELSAAIRVPVVAEGRIYTPEEARAALEQGAFAVVVGTAITRPEAITARFARALSTFRHDLVLAIDIGGSKIATALVDEKGHLTHRQECQTRSCEGAEAILGRVIRLAQDTLAMADCAPGAVGVGTGGQVDPGDGHILYATPLLPGWTGLPLRARLEEALALPVAVDNDVNVMGLGEAVFGAGRGLRHLLCLAVGTGIGGAVIINGQLYRGAQGAAGDLGHVSIDAIQGRRCNCGNVGCVEAYAAGPAIAAAWAEAVSVEENMACLGRPMASAQDVASLLSRHDRTGAEARRIICRAGRYFGYAIASLLHAFNPDAVIIGGGVAQAGEPFFSGIREAVQERALPSVRKTPILKAALGPDAALIGAAVLARQALPIR